MYDTNIDNVELTTVTHSCKDTAPGPRVSWSSIDNADAIQFVDFAGDCTGADNRGLVRVDIHLPLLFTQVRGTITVAPTNGGVVHDSFVRSGERHTAS